MFDVASAMSLSDILNEIVSVVKIRDYLICFSNSYRYGRVVQIPHLIQVIIRGSPGFFCHFKCSNFFFMKLAIH